jgi:hypothetical protein
MLGPRLSLEWWLAGDAVPIAPVSSHYSLLTGNLTAIFALRLPSWKATGHRCRAGLVLSAETTYLKNSEFQAVNTEFSEWHQRICKHPSDGRRAADTPVASAPNMGCLA